MYQRLVKLMISRNITPYRLSKATGVTQATLSRWKTGKTSPSIDTLIILADYFGVPVGYFLGTVEISPDGISFGDGSGYGGGEGSGAGFGDGTGYGGPVNEIKISKQGKQKEKSPGDITLDDFTYAMYGHSGELSDEQKAMLLDMAQLLLKQQKEREDKKKGK